MAETQNPINEKVERDVRMLIGDLQMQIIVLRSLLEQATVGQTVQQTNGMDQSARPTP